MFLGYAGIRVQELDRSVAFYTKGPGWRSSVVGPWPTAGCGSSWATRAVLSDSN
jgi:hypothetical protein